MEHLTDHDKKKEKKSRTPLESFLGIAEQQEKIEGAAANGVRICFYLSYIMNPDSRFSSHFPVFLNKVVPFCLLICK